jgi:hypothetical protein
MTVYRPQANTAKVRTWIRRRGSRDKKCLNLTTFGKNRYSLRRNLKLCGMLFEAKIESRKHNESVIVCCRLKDTVAAGRVTYSYKAGSIVYLNIILMV